MVNIGDEVKVVVTEIDRQGRINLSRRALLEESEVPEGEEPPDEDERGFRSRPPRRGRWRGGGGFGGGNRGGFGRGDEDARTTAQRVRRTRVGGRPEEIGSLDPFVRMTRARCASGAAARAGRR